MRRLLAMAAMAGLLTACATTPPPANNNLASRLPAARPASPATTAGTRAPAEAPGPAYGTPEFNALKDAPPDSPVDVSQVPDAIPSLEPRSKYGNDSPYTVLGAAYKILPTAKGFVQVGHCSWYGKKFHGHKTSSGDRYDMYGMSAAHRNLPLPTWVRVTNLANDKSVIVKVNDRGPFHTGRVMDVSYAAAVKLGMIKTGTAKVKIEALDPAEFQAQLKDNGSPEPKVVSKVADNQTQYFVQVGAFGAATSAAALQSRVLALVYAPVTVTQAEPPSTVYRVQVGPFAKREDAEKVSARLHDGDFGNPMIVSR